MRYRRLASSSRRGVFGARHEQIASHTGEWAPEGILPEVELLPPPRSAGVQRVRLGGSYGTHNLSARNCARRRGVRSRLPVRRSHTHHIL